MSDVIITKLENKSQECKSHSSPSTPIIERCEESQTSQYFRNINNKIKRSSVKKKPKTILNSDEISAEHKNKQTKYAQNRSSKRGAKDHTDETPVKKLLKIIDDHKMHSDNFDVSNDNQKLITNKRRRSTKRNNDDIKRKKSSHVSSHESKHFTEKQNKYIEAKHKNKKIKKGDEETSLEDAIKDDDSDDDDADDWEEVNGDDYDVKISKRPLQAVEVEIQKEHTKGKKTPEEQMMDEIRRVINKSKVLRQTQCHQVHLLCHLAIGLNYNKICNDPDLQALALSHLPIRFFHPTSSNWKLEDLFQFIVWFHKFFPCSHQILDHCCMELTQNLKSRFEEKNSKSIFEHVMMLVTTLRVLGFRARLIHSFESMTCIPPDLLKKSATPKASNFSKTKKSVKEDKPRSKNKSAMTSDDKLKNNFDNEKFDWWSEVFLPEEKRWIYVNSHKCVMDDFDDAKKNLKRPFTHVLAWQDEGCVKDLTSRYDCDWLLSSCRKRVDPNWWKSTLSLYRPDQSENEAEDLSIEDDLFKQPLPTSVSAYKNHPLYVMERHLLKFECIFPPSSLILGYMKDEPIYSRDRVHLLHSKEKWMVEGRTVKEGEEPYKVVKRRPKINKKNRSVVEESEHLNLFGRWQTELFVPTPAVEGVVPKNEFGNVEIFKPWMLPPGTSYLEDPLPGLNRVARKLEIDVAPAMIGWQFHRNISAPTIRGWVVCIEHKEILVEAWLEEQRNIMKMESEKRQERVLKNWKKLVRSLLVRERLKDQFCKKPNQKSQKFATPTRSVETVKKYTKSKACHNDSLTAEDGPDDDDGGGDDDDDGLKWNKDGVDFRTSDGGFF